MCTRRVTKKLFNVIYKHKRRRKKFYNKLERFFLNSDQSNGAKDVITFEIGSFLSRTLGSSVAMTRGLNSNALRIANSHGKKSNASLIFTRRKLCFTSQTIRMALFPIFATRDCVIFLSKGPSIYFSCLISSKRYSED